MLMRDSRVRPSTGDGTIIGPPSPKLIRAAHPLHLELRQPQLAAVVIPYALNLLRKFSHIPLVYLGIRHLTQIQDVRLAF